MLSHVIHVYPSCLTCLQSVAPVSSLQKGTYKLTSSLCLLCTCFVVVYSWAVSNCSLYVCLQMDRLNMYSVYTCASMYAHVCNVCTYNEVIVLFVVLQ